MHSLVHAPAASHMRLAQALDCGGVPALLDRRRKCADADRAAAARDAAAAAGASGSSGGTGAAAAAAAAREAAAREAALKEEVERVLRRFEKAAVSWNTEFHSLYYRNCSNTCSEAAMGQPSGRRSGHGTDVRSACPIGNRLEKDVIPVSLIAAPMRRAGGDRRASCDTVPYVRTPCIAFPHTPRSSFSAPCRCAPPGRPVHTGQGAPHRAGAEPPPVDQVLPEEEVRACRCLVSRGSPQDAATAMGAAGNRCTALE